MEDDIARLEPRVERIEVQLNARIDRLDAKVESKFDALEFALLIALLSATVTLAAVVLCVLLTGSHAH